MIKFFDIKLPDGIGFIQAEVSFVDDWVSTVEIDCKLEVTSEKFNTKQISRIVNNGLKCKVFDKAFVLVGQVASLDRYASRTVYTIEG